MASDVALAPADLVETATHELLNGQPDWSTNMTLIDMCNSQKHVGPVVLSALLKRLNHKKHSVGIASVLLLEALVKNCPPIVPLVADPEFMKEFVKVLPKQVRDPHNKGLFAGLKDSTRDILAVERFDKILLCIQSWASAFPPESAAVTRDRRLLIFSETFRNLQRAGVKFPAPNLDELAPVATPQKNKDVAAAKAAEHRKHLEALAEAERAQHEKQAVKFTDPDCASIADTCTLLTDMLTQSNEREDLRRNELIQQILSALKPSAAKIAQRLGVEANAASPNEKMLAQLLQANEIAMEAVGYYEGLVSGKMRRRAPAAPAAAARPSASASSSSAASPAPSPGGLAGAPPTHPKGSSEKRAVPLLQPPPPASAAASSSHHGHHGSSPAKPRASASGGSPARASPAAAPAAAPAAQLSLLDMDLLFSAPAANQPQQPQQQSRSFFDPPQQPQQQQQQYQPPPRAAPAAAAVNPGPEGAVSPPGYDEQQRLHALAVSKLPAHKQQAAAGAKPTPPAKSSFVLAPPPAAAGPAADFFSSAYGSAAAVPAAPSHPPHRGAGASSAAPAVSPAVKTPFDSPDEDDPWMSVATRSSPPAAQQPPTDDFANFGFK